MLRQYFWPELRNDDWLTVVTGQEPFVDAIHGAGVAGPVGNVIDILGKEMDGAVGKNKASARHPNAGC